MLPTVNDLREWFRRLNRDLFGNTLPMPRLCLSRSRSKLGCMSYLREPVGWHAMISDFSIHVSIYYDCDERVYQTVLLHEMIHYYIARNCIRDTSSHGQVFREKMREVNQRGWHVTVSQDTTGWKVRDGLLRRRRRLLLVIRQKGHDAFVTCVKPSHMADVGRQLTDMDGVALSWFTSDADEFQTWPESKRLRGHRVSDAELGRMLELMQPVMPDSGMGKE